MLIIYPIQIHCFNHLNSTILLTHLHDPKYLDQILYPNSDPPFSNNNRTHQPRPFRYTTRQDIFDQNRFRPSFAGAQNNYPPGENMPANNPIKRARPSDSRQSKMSIDETRYQEDMHNPYQSPYNPVYPYYPACYKPDPNLYSYDPNVYPMQTYDTSYQTNDAPNQVYYPSGQVEEEQQPLNENEHSETEQAENFLLLAPDQINT